MDHEFWHIRWREGRTGFHEGAPNDLLVAHLPALDLKPGAHVFLPLCGKTVDLDWLEAQGFHVTGVELNALAVAAVFERLGRHPEITRHGDLTRYRAGNITLWVGDILTLDAAQIGPVDAVYDRAALVALPETMRPDYARTIARLTARAPQLLICFDYDQSRTDGPPFSVPEPTIRTLYGALYTLRNLARRSIGGPLGERAEGREEAWLLEPVQEPE